MLVVGGLFLLWRKLNPLKAEAEPDRRRGAEMIVVGVDGSEGSRDAVTWAARQARVTDAPVRLVASWRWPSYVTRVPPGADPAADTQRTSTTCSPRAKQQFPDVEITGSVVQGPAGPALLTQAEGAQLLVVGARGRAAFPGMLLGSVAEYCVRNGPCPVVVVRTLAD